MLPASLIIVRPSSEHLIFIAILSANSFNLFATECEASYHKDLYEISPEGDARIPSQNLTIDSENFQLIGDYLCVKSKSEISRRHDLYCKNKSKHERGKFVILENGSALVQDEIFERGSYIVNDGRLVTCVPGNIDRENDILLPSGGKSKKYTNLEIELFYFSNVSSILSIMALSIHLAIFVTAKPLRNFPAYNLASLSIAFWLGYLFLLIGQSPKVRGTYCVASAALIFYFFLATFFWNNAISFDLWYTLRLATSRLMSVDDAQKARMFAAYSVCAWSSPAAIAIGAVVVDSVNLEWFPHEYKPGFGGNDTCFFTNSSGKFLFFGLPVQMILAVNTVFFASCAYIIVKNSNTAALEQHSTTRRNVKLYFRLGLLMGTARLLSTVAAIADSRIIWYCFALVNSLQGVFVFLMFTCTTKVWNYIRTRTQGGISSNSVVSKDSFSCGVRWGKNNCVQINASAEDFDKYN